MVQLGSSAQIEVNNVNKLKIHVKFIFYDS